MEIEIIKDALIPTQPVPSLSRNGVTAQVLRLDLIHPVISGNKWFKLRYYIAEALRKRKTEIVTFGGAWSNHIVATAAAAAEAETRSDLERAAAAVDGTERVLHVAGQSRVLRTQGSPTL